MDQNFLSFTRVPKTFQSDLFEKISTVIKKGESVQIFGAPGSGNSLIVKSLIQSADVRNLHFGDSYRFLLLDSNMLLERNSLGLSRLLLTLLSIDENISTDNSVIQTEIERRISEVCNKGKLVLVIDHMQELILPELKPFFTNLYAIFRKLEPKLNFIFVFSKSNVKLGDMQNLGLLGRLITQNSIKTPPFNKNDSYWFIEEKEKQTGLKLNSTQKEKTYMLSGGFPRTLKRLVESVGKGYKLGDLESNPSVDPLLVGHFEELFGCVEYLPDIPLFKVYVENIGKESRGETLGGVHFANKLTRNEEKILKLLLSSKNRIVEREKGIEHLWGESAVEVSDHAYDQLVHRLKKKLTGSVPKVDFETIRGRGHTLRILNS